MRSSLRDLADVEYGADHKHVNDVDGPFPIYGTGGVMGMAREYLFDGPFILVGRKGTLGNPQFSATPGWVIDTAYCVRPKRGIDAKWLYYNLCHFDLKSLNEATGVPSISRDYLYRVRFETPKFEEQRKIAEVLSTVDNLIEKTEALIAKKSAIKDGLLSQILNCGLDEGQAEMRFGAPGKPTGLPGRWKKEKYEEVCERIVVGIATSTTKHFVDEGVPMLRNQNIHAGWIDFNDLLQISPRFAEVNRSKRLCAGDIVTTRTGYPGISAVVPKMAAGWQTFTTLISTANRRKVLPEFLCLFLNSRAGRAQIWQLQGGGAQQNLNAGWISNMAVAYPSIPEQERICALLKTTEKGIEALTLEKAKFSLIKKALMGDLLLGRMPVAAGAA